MVSLTPLGDQHDVPAELRSEWRLQLSYRRGKGHGLKLGRHLPLAKDELARCPSKLRHLRVGPLLGGATCQRDRGRRVSASS